MQFKSNIGLIVALLGVLCLVTNYQINCKKSKDKSEKGRDIDEPSGNGNKRNYEQCESNEECASKSCEKSKCGPKKCRNDKACLKAGLSDHFCRKRTIFKIFDSECVPKRGVCL